MQNKKKKEADGFDDQAIYFSILAAVSYVAHCFLLLSGRSVGNQSATEVSGDC